MSPHGDGSPKYLGEPVCSRQAVTQSSTNHSLTGNSFFSTSATSVLYKNPPCYPGTPSDGGETAEKRAAPVVARPSRGSSRCYDVRTFDVCKNLLTKVSALKTKRLIFSLYSPVLCTAVSIGNCAHTCFRTTQLEEKQRRLRYQSSESRCTASLNPVCS